MARYNRLNKKDGDTLSAEDIRHMEDGISDAYDESALKEGEMKYDKANEVVQFFNGTEFEDLDISFGGGGGGAVIGTLTSEFKKDTCTSEEEINIDYFFTSPNVGKGTLKVSVNGKEVISEFISQGAGVARLGTLAKGTNEITMYVVDRGGVYTNQLTFRIACGGLEISSSFDSNKDYSISSLIKFNYTVDTVSTAPILLNVTIDNNVHVAQAENGYNTYVFPELSVGVHKVSIVATSGDMVSNVIEFNLVIADSNTLFISTMFNKKSEEEGNQVSIDYRISMKGQSAFDVEYFIDGSSYKKLECKSGTSYWNISTLALGTRTLKIKATTKDGLNTDEITVSITIVPSSYEMKKPITQGLLAWFDATDLSNNDLGRDKWKDKTANGVVATLHNFNYATNGWFNNALRMNGTSYAKIDIAPFAENAQDGLTIDLLFSTRDIGKQEARVMDCTSSSASGVGCYLDTLNGYLKSTENTLNSPFSENEKTRVTYVIDRENKLAEVYINAVICEVVFLSDQGSGNDTILEDFMHNEVIYLNSRKGTDLFGECEIYNLRVYGRALSAEEVLTNHIADIKDKAEQKKKYDHNYNDSMPTMYFYGDTSAMTKDYAVPLRIKYIATEGYGQSFDLDACSVSWQGTSSLQYAVKNYKIKLKDGNGNKYKYTPFENGIEESTFCLKADYMESSHANNTGTAKIINRYLYDSKLPPQELDPKVKSAIDGFPIQLYINDKLMGVFNFNLDKGCDASFGLDTEKFPECLSYEVVANSDSTAGAFNKWTPDKTEIIDGVVTPISELKYLQNDFELRYPDEDDVGKDYGYIEHLKRVIDWVSDASDETFKAEFDQYFDREYTFRYYLLVIVFGMVDNLGKNMMLNTWDGNIWYPCFYDLDTSLALDNSGYLKFDVDIEVEAGMFNTSASKLWSKLARVFESELKDMYKDMRAQLFKEENILEVLIGEQISKISERLYNIDTQRKYLDFGKQYLHMLHGNRKEHLKRWLRERLLYVDTLFGYEEQTRDSITIRANKQGAVYLDIQTYSPMYLMVRWRNGEEQTKKIGRGKTVRFNSSLPTATDQEVLVYGAKHIKDLGDLSNLAPSSLSLGNATKLTRLKCTSPNLMALGVSSMSFLQDLDLAGCSKLGTATGGANVLDISECTNIKKVNIEGTQITSVKTNADGGNLEEIRYPKAIKTIFLKNQFNLKTVYVETYINLQSLYYGRYNYDSNPDITSIHIENAPLLEKLGGDLKDNKINMFNECYDLLALKNVKNFDGSELYTKEEFLESLNIGALLCKVETFTLINACTNIRWLTCLGGFHLKTLTLSDLPFLRGINFIGNYTSGWTGGNTNCNVEFDAMFENIDVKRCNSLETLAFSTLGISNTGYKFKENYELDLSNLTTLKRFYMRTTAKNLKKIKLPEQIEEVILEDNISADTVVIGEPTTQDFVGCDFKNVKLNDFSISGLKYAPIVKGVNAKIVKKNPGFNANRDGTESRPYIKEFYGKLDLSEYEGTSLAKAFKNLDFTNIEIDFNSINFKNVTNISEMFDGCTGVRNLVATGWDLSKVELMLRAFANTSFETIDIGTTDTRACTNWDTVFTSNSNLVSLKVGFTVMKGRLWGMFQNCALLSTLDLSLVEKIVPNDASPNMFSSCSSLKTIDLSKFVFNEASTLKSTFSGCANLETIDLSNLDFSKVTDFSGMFYGCTSLKTILGIETINTDSATTFKNMFAYSGIERFDMPNWNIINVTDISEMFRDCKQLVSVDLANVDFGMITSTGGMFNGCSKLTSVNLTGTNFVRVTGVRNMFRDCTELKSLYLTDAIWSEHDISEITANSGVEIMKVSKCKLYNYNHTLPNLVELHFEDSPNLTLGDYALPFVGCKLKRMYFKNSVIIDVHSNSRFVNNNLEVEALVNVFNALADLTGQTAKTIPLGSANLAKLSAEQLAIATNKNWTVTA